MHAVPLPSPSLVVAGETLALLPERAAYWAARGTLLVADVHVGKAATLRAAGAPIPGGTTTADLARLGRAVERTGATRVVVLGDLFHARAGRRAEPTLAAFRRWRERHADLDLLLVRGNHDVHAGDPPAELGIGVVEEPHAEGPFVWRHVPEPDERGYVVAGHLHPAVALHGAGGERVTLACFHFGARVGLLPAFGSTTGTLVVRAARQDRVYVVTDDEVVAV
ncbi:MAG: ligase-associated DNA damage response endonuclease PdeM [Rhodothermales bacterium]|nr:ligase-associated DNA damage response endonuclease PdeM [Rhodothermales bacterium]